MSEYQVYGSAGRGPCCAALRYARRFAAAPPRSQARYAAARRGGSFAALPPLAAPHRPRPRRRTTGASAAAHKGGLFGHQPPRPRGGSAASGFALQWPLKVQAKLAGFICRYCLPLKKCAGPSLSASVVRSMPASGLLGLRHAWEERLSPAPIKGAVFAFLGPPSLWSVRAHLRNRPRSRRLSRRAPYPHTKGERDFPLWWWGGLRATMAAGPAPHTLG